MTILHFIQTQEMLGIWIKSIFHHHKHQKFINIMKLSRNNIFIKTKIAFFSSPRKLIIYMFQQCRLPRLSRSKQQTNMLVLRIKKVMNCLREFGSWNMHGNTKKQNNLTVCFLNIDKITQFKRDFSTTKKPHE